MKKRSILISAVVLLCVAAAGIYFVTRHHGQSTNAQDSGSDSVQINGGDAANKDNPSPTGGGANNQGPASGEIAAENVAGAKTADVIGSEKAAVPPDMTDNGLYVIDTARKLIKILPKAGAWNDPFVGIPLREKETVHPQFSSNPSKLSEFAPGEYLVGAQSLYGIATRSSRTTSAQPFYMHYEKLPSKLFFGNWQTPMYEVSLK